MDALGVIELNSIARGIETADAMVKASSVELLEAKSICPGKYLIIIAGSVSEVENSIDMGKSLSKSFFVDEISIPNIHPQVIEAIRGIASLKDFGAIGVLEFFSTTGSIYAADAAVKAADVSIVDIRLGYAIGGKSYVTLTGDLSAIEAALEAGKEIGQDKGLLFNASILPSPSKQLLRKLV